MFIKCLIISVVILSARPAFAQTISGIVKTQSGEGIGFATVAVLNSATGTVSDKDGHFTLAVGNGIHKLAVNAVGYSAKLVTATAGQGAATLDIALDENTQTLGEVVVTANKREEDILRVATSITSLSARKIEDTRTWGLSGLTALVPNYNYQELGVAFQQIQSIRGIQVFSENPAVATYIDDVNNLDMLANGIALTDVERIEVLRGPQGTLFGRNAMGGVVNIVTKKPTNKTGGFAEAGFGNLGLQRHSAGIKTPLINDKLFLGINGLYQSRDGYWKNDTTGTHTTDRTANGRTVGGEKNLYGNLYLRWLPAQRFSATLNMKAQRDWSDNTAFFVSQRSETVALTNPDKINLARVGQHDRHIVNSSLTLKYVGENLTLTSISTRQTINLSFRDVDYPGFYHSFYRSVIGEKLPPQQVYSQEIRVNSSNTTSNLHYTAGVYGFTQVGYEPSTNLAYELSPTNFAIFRNKSNNAGIAGFGEVTYALSPALKATAGVRYDYEKRGSTFNGFGDALLTNGVFKQIKPDTTVSGTYSALSPKLALSYALSSHSNLYVSYTRGFRPGGVNAQGLPKGIRQTFDPEYSNNYEVGYKVASVGNKLRLAASAFLIQWQSLQFFNLVAPFTYARQNVGNAHSTGIELEASTIPVKGLQVDASIGLNATEYQNFTLKRVDYGTGKETATVVSGNTLSNAPGHTLFLGVQYVTPLTRALTATLRGEMRRLGSYYTDIQNTLQQPAYTLLNARAGLTRGQVSLFVWGQNLTNTRYLAFGSPDTSFGRSVRTAAPATYGVTLSTRF